MEDIGHILVVIASPYYILTPPRITKTRVHLQFLKISGWPI